jgi:hypothetical protein
VSWVCLVALHLGVLGRSMTTTQQLQPKLRATYCCHVAGCSAGVAQHEHAEFSTCACTGVCPASCVMSHNLCWVVASYPGYFVMSGATGFLRPARQVHGTEMTYRPHNQQPPSAVLLLSAAWCSQVP